MTDFISSTFSGLLSAFLVVVLLAGCSGESSRKKDRTSSNNSGEPTQQDRPRSPETLPPNAAHITGFVESVDTEKQDGVQVQFQIRKVVGYGPSTKPLSESQVMSLTTSKEFLTKQNLQPVKGDSLSLIISQSMTLGESKQNTWRIVDIK